MFLENTAGGEHAVARRFDALARLWEGVAAADTEVELGFCFDTCHAHAAGEDLADAVERAVAITGRIDLLHVNDSRDPPGTGADRHANIGSGTIDLDALRHMIRAADAPSVVETPRELDALRADVEFVRAALSRRLGRQPSSERFNASTRAALSRTRARKLRIGLRLRRAGAGRRRSSWPSR